MRFLLLGLIVTLSACVTAEKPPSTGVDAPSATAISTASTAVSNRSTTRSLSSALSSASASKEAVATVATDLVSAIIQLEEFSPLTTTLQFSEPSSQFGRELFKAFKTSGYGIQVVSLDQGTNYVTYERNLSTETTSETDRTSFSVTIKKITVSRIFKTVGGSLIPDTPIFIEGSKPQSIVLQNDIYSRTDRDIQLPNGVVFIDEQGNSQTNSTRITESYSGEKLSNELALSLAKQSALAKSKPQPTSDNLFRPAKQLLIPFKQESLELGDENKRAIQHLTRKFSNTNHRFAITACNSSYLHLSNNEQASALNRGQRVKQELLSLNIPIEYTELASCSIGKYTNSLTDKSVVLLTLESKSRGFF